MGEAWLPGCHVSSSIGLRAVALRAHARGHAAVNRPVCFAAPHFVGKLIVLVLEPIYSRRELLARIHIDKWRAQALLL
jgi:hypothetical protein